MALVEEDGTGLAGANSFVDAAYVIAYAADRGLSFPTVAAAQTAALILAADYLANEARFPYVGTRHLTTQRLPWPRDGASERGGRAIDPTYIPTRLKDAQAELAILSGQGASLQDDLDNGGLLVQSDKVDVLETTYMKPSALQILTGIPGETLKTTVVGFLSPILRLPGSRLVSGTLAQAPDASPYLPGQFDAPGAISV